MDKLSPHKTFIGLHDTSHLPGVNRHTPVPRRDKPLPGTKAMRHPKDAHLLEMVRPGLDLEHPKPLRLARGLGWIAVASAVALVGVFQVAVWCHHNLTLGPGLIPAGLLFVAVHVCGLFAGVLSEGKVRTGYLAIAGLYGGWIATGVIDHFVS